MHFFQLIDQIWSSLAVFKYILLTYCYGGESGGNRMARKFKSKTPMELEVSEKG